MITLIRSVVSMPGRNGELAALAREVVASVKRITGQELTLAARFGGNFAEIAFIMQAESLAQAEAVISKSEADPSYREVVKKVAGLAVPGAASEQVWRHL
jgi:hypothetical protein